MQKRFLNLAMAVFLTLLFVGCQDEEAKINKMTPKETDALAREFITALNQKSTDKAEKLIEPSVRAEAKPKLKELVQLLDHGSIEQMKVLGIQGQVKDDQKLIRIAYQIYFKNAWVISSLAILETPKDRFIVSVRMDPLKQSLEKFYAFKFFGKPPLHYVMLFIVMLVPAFIVYVLIQCLRMPGNQKWFWIPFIVIGVMTLHFDWSNGRAVLQPFSLLIFGAAFMKQLYGPVIFSFSLPVGALIFFFTHLFKKSKSSSPAAI